MHCEYVDLNPVPTDNGRYCYVSTMYGGDDERGYHSAAAVQVAAYDANDTGDAGGFLCQEAVLAVLDLSSAHRFKYVLKMNVDDRGSFTELVHTQDCGQVNINVSKSGITRG